MSREKEGRISWKNCQVPEPEVFRSSTHTEIKEEVFYSTLKKLIDWNCPAPTCKNMFIILRVKNFPNLITAKNTRPENFGILQIVSGKIKDKVGVLTKWFIKLGQSLS